jgi:Ham1 family
MARRLADGTRLVLASHNSGKLVELADLLRPHAVEVIPAGTLGLPEPPEDAPDFCGNARIKAGRCCRRQWPAGARGRFRLLRCCLARRTRHLFSALGRPRQKLCRRNGAGAARNR